MTAEICRKCGKEKSIRTSLTHDIIYACSVFDRKLYRIEYYKKNKDKKAEYGKKIKKKVMNFYSSGEMRCRDCKEDILELLTIEHINGGGVKQRKEMRSHNIYKWLIKENFPPGYAVLCIRCNWLKGKVSKERYEEILQEIKQRDAIMIKA